MNRDDISTLIGMTIVGTFLFLMAGQLRACKTQDDANGLARDGVRTEQMRVCVEAGGHWVDREQCIRAGAAK